MMSAIQVMEQSFTLSRWLLGLSPILLVSVLMIRGRWAGSKAGALAWLWAMVVAVTVFGGNAITVASGSAKGLWETVFILAIIWGAMSIYGLVDAMQGFPVITDTFNRVTGGDRLLQVLVIGMVFPAWMQGVLGFGTPVAVTAPLLLGLGFDPVISVVIPALGHSWTITFGSLGSSYWVLQRFTGLAEGPLALWSAILFVPMTVMVFFFGTFYYSRRIYGCGWREVRRGWFAWLSLGLVQAVALLVFATTVSPSIAGFLAGFVGLVWGALLRRMPFYKPAEADSGHVPAPPPSRGEKSALTFHQAFLPYYVVIAVVFVVYLSPFASQLLGTPNLRAALEAERFRLGPYWPEIRTALGFVNPSETKYSPLKVFTMPGTLIFASLALSVMIYRLLGILRADVGRKVSARLSKAAVPASLTLMTLSMMAGVMMEHGITTLLAVATAKATGMIYPFFANYIGQLGAFITGSNTASNLLFGAFQRDAALVLGVSPYLIAGLQTVGGAIGNIHCPLNVVLATSTVGIPGREGEVISQTLVAGLIMGAVIGLVGLLLALFAPVAVGG